MFSMSGINYSINTFIQTHSDEFHTSKECGRVHTCSQVSLVMSVGQDHFQLWKRMCRFVACILCAIKLKSLKPSKAEMMQTYSCHHKFNYSKFPCIFPRMAFHYNFVCQTSVNRTYWHVLNDLDMN
jgi:hypothetical protein